jgi:hypothetical protein
MAVYDSLRSGRGRNGKRVTLEILPAPGGDRGKNRHGESESLKVIVNADDLGTSLEVNNAIFQLIAMGRVTSATLLANGAALTDAAKRSKSFPQCSFGVHLNASQWQPLTHDPDLRPILDDSGCFAGKRVLRLHRGAGPRGDTGIHQEARRGGQAPRADESVALTGHL